MPPLEMPPLEDPSDFDELSSPAGTDDESSLTMHPTVSVDNLWGLLPPCYKKRTSASKDHRPRKKTAYHRSESKVVPETESEPELNDGDADELASTDQHKFGSGRSKSRSAEADRQVIKEEIADAEDADDEDEEDEKNEDKGKELESKAHEIKAPRKSHQYPPITLQKPLHLWDGMKMPLAVTELDPVKNLDVPSETEIVEFTLEFLKSALNVHHYEHSWYKKGIKKELKEIPIISCMILEGDHEPLLPQFPGDHGARISVSLLSRLDQDEMETNRTEIPLFIRRGNQGYRYYGTYGEPRAPDRIGANEIREEVPRHIKSYWARRMGQSRKPQWAIEAIRQAWPKTPVGWVDDEMSLIDYDEELEDPLGAPLKAPISALEAEKVTANEIAKAFDNPDMGNQPTMRLYYEYLKCDGYDRAFYEELVARGMGERERR